MQWNNDLIDKFLKETHPDGKRLTDYLNCYTKINWQCEFDHFWDASWTVIRNHHWCPHCVGRALPTVENMQKFLKINHPGGECLSEKYVHDKHKLSWRCEFDHIWTSTWNNIQSGNWCPVCAKCVKGSIEEIEKFLNENHFGSECLSEFYNNQGEKMVWKCECGFIWLSGWGNIKNGNWCPYCTAHNPYSIEYINYYIEDTYPKAKCLSLIYKTNKTLMEWQCEFGHVWWDNWSKIRQGDWCPICNHKIIKSRWKGENICKTFLEKVFNDKFIKIRHHWLINPKTNRKLELDGYCESLNIAFEYQGLQHSQIVSRFHGTAEKLQSQQFRDEIKKIICKERNVHLIIIPQFTIVFQPKHLKEFLKNQFNDLNIKLPENYNDITLNLEDDFLKLF